MTTQARPPRPGDPNVVEMDAIDGAEWERDQHTPPAPAAGLAALVRQTAAPPMTDETRSLRPPAKQVRRQPPKPPAGSRPMTAPGMGPLPKPDASPLPIASAQPIAPSRRATPEAAVNFDEPVTVPMNQRQQAVLLPLQAPSTGPVVTPAPQLAPQPIATGTLPAVPDHTPPRAADALAPDQPADRAPAANLTPWFGSLRMMALIGGAITAVLIVVAILLIQRPSPAPHVASATLQPEPVRRAPPPPPRPPVRDPVPAAPPELSPTTMPGTVPIPAAPPHALTTRTPAARVEPAERPDRPARATDRRPKGPRPVPTLKGRRQAAVPMPTLAEMNADDEPAIAQARAAYATGNQLLFDGDFPAAIQSYQKALEYAPSYAAGYRGLGLAYAVQGDEAEALKAFRSYLGLAPHAKDVALIKQRIAGLSRPH